MQEEVKPKRKSSQERKDEILQTLAIMLQNPNQVRITTASLAKEVGVSEAALYRHFKNKAGIYLGLIEFIEHSLFTRINLIMKEQESTLARCQDLLTLLLAFAQHNPGLSRLLTGEALIGEDELLLNRITRVFDRVETQIKQALRDTEIREGKQVALSTTAAASMLLAIAEGRIVQFVRSGFKRLPLHEWETQWQHLAKGLII